MTMASVKLKSGYQMISLISLIILLKISNAKEQDQIGFPNSTMFQPTTSSELNLRSLLFSQNYQDGNDESDFKGIPVNIALKPVEYFDNKVYVSTGTNLTATAEILDERFRNLNMTYQWSSKNKTIITGYNATQIVYRYEAPDPDNFLKVLVLYRNGTADTTGMSQKNLVIRDPISIADPVGKLFLEQGDLLMVTLKFTGSGPYTHCYKICYHGEYKDECKSCRPTEYTSLIDNRASRVEKHYSVRIIGTVREQTIPYFPIVCSILAVFILLTGVALHMKCRRTVYTETADFDFMRSVHEAEEEWFEELSFGERVRYLLLGARQDDQENLMNRSRTV